MAICEQVGDQPVKGLFPREVVRVVTPGTVIEPGLLKGDRNNYLVGHGHVSEQRAGIAYVDITTGEFAATELESSDLAHRAARRADPPATRPRSWSRTTLDLPDGLPGHITALDRLAL